MKAFNGKYSVVELLDEYFRLPSGWMVEDEEGLKKELKDRLSEASGENECLND